MSRRLPDGGDELPDCADCEGSGRVLVDPWCMECGEHGDALKRPCPDDPTGHTVPPQYDACSACGGTGDGPDVDPHDEDPSPPYTREELDEKGELWW